MDFWVTVTQLVERHVSWQCSEHHQWNPTHRYCIGVETEGDILKPGHAEPKLSAWIDTVFGWRGCERTICVDCWLMGVGLQRVSITLSHWDATLCTSVGDAQVQFVSTCVGESGVRWATFYLCCPGGKEKCHRNRMKTYTFISGCLLSNEMNRMHLWQSFPK